MEITAEYLRKFEDYSAFQDSFQAAMKSRIRSFPSVRVLDYGGGSDPKLHGLLFDDLHKRQRLLVYDPNVDPRTYHALPPKYRKPWTADKPTGKFDLVICHFSLHHIELQPRDIIREMRGNEPKFIAIAEFDFSEASKDDFEETFATQEAQKELQTVFGGDLDKCFRFHTRYRKVDYEKALGGNDYQIIARGVGKGAARYMFYLIAEPEE